MNPSLKQLEPLVGKWVMELSNASFLPDHSTTVRGTTSCEWIEGGDFLAVRQGAKGAGTPYSVWLIGRDKASSEYTALYFDDRGVSRVYRMSFKSGIWKLWRVTPKFSQRFEGKLSKDKKTIKAQWEKKFGSKKWEHDFDLTYSKRK